MNRYADVGTHAIQTRFFGACQPVVGDPIFKLLQQFRRDQRPDKLDLGIGVYRNEYGGSPIFSSVKLAERMRLDVEAEKAYIGPAGDREYCDYLEALALGENYPEVHRDRLTTVQTPGGVGALRMAFELMVVSANSRESVNVEKMLMATAIELYFTPPAHGGAVVKKILRSPQLRELWQQELSEIRFRLKDVRRELRRRLELQGVDFEVSYLVQQKGMFSLLQLTPQALNALREDHGIYIVDSGRINIAGLNPQNMEHFARAVTAVGG